jgi:hypothetical protein
MKKLTLLFAFLPAAALAQATVPAANPLPKPELTEIWSPVPPKVEPVRGGRSAVRRHHPVQRQGSCGLGKRQGRRGGWAVENGEMVDVPKAGDIRTSGKFGDIQLHVEWMVPVLPPDRKGQDRGNSGIYLQGLYEVQVLDNYDNPTYVNGSAGSIYKQSVPLVNALKRAPNWQDL